jgi:DNA-binding NtrC family response regulator
VFEAAEGGTILLDEIGDISMGTQTSLLRVLEQREITRVGDSMPVSVDVRILAATNRNLADDVDRGTFREDLFYRLRVGRISVPALRERRDDIPVLAKFFLQNAQSATGKAVSDIGSEALGLLMKYDWPGNVRELKHAIHFAVIGASGASIDSSDLPPEIRSEPIRKRSTRSEQVAAELPLSGDERERLLQALSRAGGNRTRAARLLGMSRATFYRRLSEHSIGAKSSS